MRDQIVKDAKRLVLKVGSRLVASKGSGLNTERIDHLAGELSALKAQGREIVMVSSGAIVCGIEKLGLPEYPKSLPHKQAAAARSEEHTSELQSQSNLVCRLLLEKKKNK